MKKFLLFTIITAISMASIAQGKSGQKGNNGQKVKSEKPSKANDVYTGSSSPNGNAGVTGSAGNQPKKVTAALFRDYPSASNVVWSKYKGDYTATFRNGGLFTSTAVYHANGSRRDTRTPLTRQQLPGTIWDGIFRRDNVTPAEIVQIERPNITQKIFRVLGQNNTAYYYNPSGQRV